MPPEYSQRLFVPSPRTRNTAARSARSRLLGAGVVALLLVACFAVACRRPAAVDRILVAKTILTVDSDRPIATHVAVVDGRIAAVGTLEDVEAVTAERALAIDRTFADKVLVPGFIDPHVHPTLAATILSLDIVSAMEWTTPDGRTEAVRGREAFLARLRVLDEARSGSDWLLVWGYHAPYHGELSRADLDEISRERPIFVWQRSVHEMFFNTRALDELGFSEEDFDRHPQADWTTGHLWEQGTLTLGRPMTRVLAKPGRYLGGLSKMTEVFHRGGLTTVGEQGFPQVSAVAEWLSLRFEMWKSDAPYRFALVPNAMFLAAREADAVAAEKAADSMRRWSSDRIRIVKHAKYYADGAIFSQLMQMTEPYLDGHHGEWMMTPDEQAEVLRAFWEEGWDLHIHVNGDAGLDVVLDQIEERQRTSPSSARRVVLEHYGFAREDQHARVEKLGISVSNNAYYLHELAPIYAKHGLGQQRAKNISPLGALSTAGVPVSFHSDFPMAPAEPLLLMWVAVNRIGSDNEVWGVRQRIGLDEALRAVTIEGARSLGMEDEVGSIEPGKRADFTVLERNPYEVDPKDLRDIEIWGTVFEGRARPILVD